MIKSLTLNNFRKVVDDTMHFLPGLNVIKGANEASKSTRAEGIGYALFGSKALRTAFDDAVTWGARPASLKASVVITVDDKDYTFTRSKAGAECVYDGGMVTGQNEVSEFAAKLLGVDGPTAFKLMLASQGSLRGALDQGPRATSELIEDLAEFDLFETILERMQEKLTLGAVGPAQNRVDEALAALEALPITEKPNTEAMHALLDAGMKDIAANKKWIEEVGEPQSKAAEAAFDMAAYKQEQHDLAKGRLDAAVESLRSKENQRNVEAEKAKLAPNPARLTDLQRQLDQAEQHTARAALYDAMVKLNKYTGDVWDGDEDSLNKAVAEAEALIVKLKLDITTYQGDIREARATMVTSSHCGFCNQDVSQFPEVAKRNAAAEATIATREAAITNSKQTIASTESDLADLKAVQAASGAVKTLLGRAGDRIVAKPGTVPAVLEWVGEAPGPAPDVKALKLEIDELTRKTDAAKRSALWVETLTETIATETANLEKLRVELETTFKAPLDKDQLEDAKNAANTKLWECRWKTTEVETNIANIRQQIDTADKAFNDYLARRDELKARVAEAKEDLATLNFNNALLKKVRAARPIISDKLWNTVLSAVSTMFSQMRGETSVVTKGKDGFSINGATFTSLSGSTLDLLGLAIRIALVKTFIPRCSFLILDEPFAACDEDRSARMLGFIASSGFDQMIVITHEENSEAVADNLMYL